MSFLHQRLPQVRRLLSPHRIIRDGLSIKFLADLELVHERVLMHQSGVVTQLTISV